jgi:hypothetical protein
MNLVTNMHGKQNVKIKDSILFYIYENMLFELWRIDLSNIVPRTSNSDGEI